MCIFGNGLDAVVGRFFCALSEKVKAVGLSQIDRRVSVVAFQEEYVVSYVKLLGDWVVASISVRVRFISNKDAFNRALINFWLAFIG